MTRALLVGSIGAGKTTLAHRLAGLTEPAGKTQQTTLVGDVLDTPGEYLDHGRMHHALLLASYEADVVLMLRGAGDAATRLAPGFASYFTCPVVGVVTKIDEADARGADDAEADLLLAGAQPVVRVSSVTGLGIQELMATVEEVLA